MTKWIHSFDKKLENIVSERKLVGNKGLNLCLMKQMDLPVPSGFIQVTLFAELIPRRLDTLSFSLTEHSHFSYLL